jgi:ribosome-binding factor A
VSFSDSAQRAAAHLKESFVMASRRFSRKPPADLCSEWTADDGTDPRFSRERPQGKVSNRKALQLCRQVERALSVLLEGEILRELTVQSVVPAPDSRRLLVMFVYHGPESVASADVLAALHGYSARLRGEVAASIHRRKTPELSFRVLRT